MTEQEKAFWELWDKLEPMMEKFDTKPTLREMFDYGYRAAMENVAAWVEENRSGIEFEPGEVHYRDHFTSKSLMGFIKGENK